MTVAAPILTALVSLAILTAINIDRDGAARQVVSVPAVRTALAAVLKQDLTAARLEAVLSAPLAAPGVSSRAVEPQPAGTPTNPAKGPNRNAPIKDKPVSTPTLAGAPDALAKIVAARLADRPQPLVAALTICATNPFPGLDPLPSSPSDPIRLSAAATAKCVENDKKNRASGTAAVVIGRLSDDAIGQVVADWVTSVDPLTRSSLTGIAGFWDSFPARAQRAIDAEALRRSVREVVAPSLNPFDPTTGEHGWALDASGRLLWALVALVLCLAFAFVLAAALMQIRLIAPGDRWLFVGATAILLAFALFLHGWVPSLEGTPLHTALISYSTLLELKVVGYGRAFDVLRVIGVVLLMAGSVATFLVRVADKSDLEQQVRGFKGLYNAGTVLMLVGVLEIYARYRWPLTFIADEPTRQPLLTLAGAFAVTVGALYVAVLLTAYLPTTIVLRRQAIAHGILPVDVDQVLTTAGFGDLTAQQTLRFAQAFGPLLPGLIAVSV